MTNQTYYTLVQHSACVAKGAPMFQGAVELRALSKADDIKTVTKAGGLLFNTYGEAEAREESENYAAENDSLIPTVKGQFSDAKIEGSPIYIPANVTS